MPSLAVTPMLLGSQVAIRVARAAVPNKSGAAVHGRGRSGMTREPSGSPNGGRGEVSLPLAMRGYRGSWQCQTTPRATLLQLRDAS